MISILVVANRELSLHLVEVAEQIMGKQENLFAISLQAGESLKDISDKISKAIEECLVVLENQEPSKGILILTDLFGSTPTNASTSQVRRPGKPIEILTGVNLPMLISALSNRDKMELNALTEKVLTDGRRGIQNANELLLDRLKK